MTSGRHAYIHSKNQTQLSTFTDNKMNYVWTQERPPILPDVTDYQVLVVEASVTLIYDIRRSKDVTDILVSLSSLYRAVTGRSAIGSSLELFNKLAETLRPHLPGYFQSKSDWVDVLEDFHKNLHRVRDSTLGMKVISVINHTVAHTLYHKMGIEVDGNSTIRLKKATLRLTFGMLHHLLMLSLVYSFLLSEPADRPCSLGLPILSSSILLLSVTGFLKPVSYGKTPNS